MSERFNKWRNGLAKTSKATFGQIASLLGASEITDETYEDLEALLIKSDLGIDTSETLLDVLWEQERKDGLTKTTELTELLRKELRRRLDSPPELNFSTKPTVILIVGVNGSGKTTSIAKLGKRYQDQGLKVIFGAADTYRAAAVDQLQVWGERLSIPVIAGQQDGDPGAVAYDTVQSAIARKFDLAFIDTAGRLHTRYNLMEELKKVHRVVGKAMPGAPHAVWLVMDATTGQNALQQAHAFKEAVNVSGIILAKLDSSARGGMAFAIQQDLGLPIIFAGLGEAPDDLQPFDPDLFVDGILAQQE
jgi:fused signal recognition particle receptor